MPDGNINSDLFYFTVLFVRAYSLGRTTIHNQGPAADLEKGQTVEQDEAEDGAPSINDTHQEDEKMAIKETLRVDAAKDDGAERTQEGDSEAEV